MKERKITASGLKYIAMGTMFIDHIGIMMGRYGASEIVYTVMRSIGRLAFPLFAFLLVEGFVNTKSFWKYFIRIIAFALISEFPYELLKYDEVMVPGVNILFNFSLSLLMLLGIRCFEDKKAWGKILCMIIVAIAAVVSSILNLEYGWKCILLVAVIYLFKRNYLIRNILIAVVLLIDVSVIGTFAILAIIPINAYNGNRGKFPELLGYFFYPAHMWLLLMMGIVISSG